MTNVTKTVFQGEQRQDNLLQKLISKKSFWLVFWLFLFSYPIVRSVYRELPPPLPKYFQLPEYELVDEFGKKFGSKDLKGKVQISSFFFTSCPSVCAAQMKKMQIIQKRVKGLGQNIVLTTFTVDPDHDTPEVLYKYARKLQTNPYVWRFLTGPLKDIHNLIVNGYKVTVGEKEDSNDLYDIVHSEKFVLVDKKGLIRGYYSSDIDSINKLMVDTGLLVNNSFQKEVK